MDKRKNNYNETVNILIDGRVQGVGFRPFLVRLANKLSICGQVKNIGSAVLLTVTAQKSNYLNLINEIKLNKPSSAFINSIDVKKSAYKEFNGFNIVNSQERKYVHIIPPDLPVCENCLRELYQKGNRRELHPFISCAECGPRYSIIEKTPYDRENTTMKDFSLCKECDKEYNDVCDRRYNAQTISCFDCGPKLIFKGEDEELFEDSALNIAISILKNNGIIAIKGIGGYHLGCSPFDTKAVLMLREIKGREQKPLAVMFKDIEYLKEFANLTKKEEEIITSYIRPIVLLKRKASDISSSVYKNSEFIGAFLPYTPLHYLLLNELSALVLTSANFSDQPIIKDDNEMLNFAKNNLDGVLYNKRRILRSLDDSVIRVIGNTPQIIRRSRGFAPEPVFLKENSNNIFALGGDLKATFCLTKNGYAYLSQYIGDLEDKKTFDNYTKTYEDMKNLLNIKPNLIVCDMHPNYFSSKFAKSLNLPIIYAQHHHSHIASVMAEHKIEDKIIGIAFDGTGFGEDEKIWGGEILICEGGKYKREGHLKYTKLLGGDNLAKDALKTSTCFLNEYGLKKYIKDNRKDIILKGLNNNINTVESSSIGRLFDCISSILELGDINNYEGECAILLENAANSALKKRKKPYLLHFEINNDKNIIINPKSLLEEILIAKEKGIDIKCLALGFHYALADAVLEACTIINKKTDIKKVALSGGVFQNGILLKKCRQLLKRNNFLVYTNEKLPPNDGGIAYGQAFIGEFRIKKE